MQLRYTAIALVVIGWALLGTSSGSDHRPNIIVIYSDDHGHADLGVQNVVADIKTPYLDALARRGVVARHGYSTAPQCVPSRGGLMVGKFQGRFNLDNNGSSLDGFNKEVTIAERLRDAGYATAHFGKWHLGATDQIPQHGFMHTFAQNAQRPFSANITLDGKDKPMGNLPPTLYHIEGCSRAAASIIERYKDQPFFLYVAYRAPHTPLDAPAKYTQRFPGKMPERRRQALAMLSAVDDGVGLIQETLAKHKLTERTLIFFIGDNGAPLKIHKADNPLDGDAGGWDGSLNTPLNGEKGMLAEGGMHVPFLISWPGSIPGDQNYAHPVCALDVAATAAAVANLTTQPGDLDGVNLMPYLKGDRAGPPHESLMWRWSAQSAIREGNWKLLRGGEREYLFDLSNDLEEKHDRAAAHPEIAVRLREKLTAWCNELQPPGLALGQMSKAWNEYYDFYLDGKPAPREAEAETETTKTPAFRGWQARGGKLTEKDGVLEFASPKDKEGDQARGKAARGFITRNGLQLKAPAVVKLTARSSGQGELMLAWRTTGEKDFAPGNQIRVTVDASQQWQSKSISLPAKETIVHLRIHFVQGNVQLREIELP